MASICSDCSSLCGIPSSSSVPSSQKQWRRVIPGISFRRHPFFVEKNCVRSANHPCVRAVFMKEGLAAAASERESASRNLNNGNGVTPLKPSEQRGDAVSISSKNDSEPTVSITVVGASGDLAKKKIYPALFALFYEGGLPEHFTIFGYARSKMTDAELRTMVSKTLTCRIDKRENCNDKMKQFLERCFYHSGQYDSVDNFAALDKKLKEQEASFENRQLVFILVPFLQLLDTTLNASKKL